MDKVKKIFNFEVKQIGNEVDRKLLMVGSTETQDRDGDIIEALGWDLTDYKNNPVIMGFHEYDKLTLMQLANNLNLKLNFQQLMN
jgi:glycerate kinase